MRELSEIKNAIFNEYGIEADLIQSVQTGVGGETYLIKCASGKYIFKIIKHGGINHPENEPAICDRLRENGIGVPDYLLSVISPQKRVTAFSANESCHLQTFIAGEHYTPHTLSGSLLYASATVLAGIHQALESLPPLPYGIDGNFFKYMTPERAAVSYKNSLNIAASLGDEDILCDLRFRLSLAESISCYHPDFSRLTLRNTHGDYTVNQLIYRDDEIVGVVDWSCACRHPVIWELTRSFMYAASSAVDGEVDETEFSSYVSEYERTVPLTFYDKEQLLRLYLYQLAVCDYYGQYFAASEQNREEYLWQAKFATRVLRKNKDILHRR